VFTAPLTVDEYRALVDVKYRPGVETIPGWALHDRYGCTRGWHPAERGSRHWARSDDAFKAFVADTKERRKLALLGWQIVATTGIEDLAQLLATARGDGPAPEVGPR
jgi:hypothetical protein